MQAQAFRRSANPPVEEQVGCVAQPRTRLVGMQATACYTSILRFSGRVCGLATHAVDRGAGYGLLTISWKTWICRSGIHARPTAANTVYLDQWNILLVSIR